MSTEKQNPLLSPQREKAGSETAADYAYQYHWALYRAIQDHQTKTEYAIFIELHEDVIIANSLDSEKAKFEFNQIKTTKRKFTPAELLRKKNGTSILGKLIGSASGKPFWSSVSELNLVAVSGFGIKLTNPKLKLDKITVNEIEATELVALTLAIKSELKLDSLPKNLQFIIPALADTKFQNDVIAEIAKLIAKLFPASYFNPVDIYRILIDELNRKGEVTYDFTKWNDLLERKALTSVTVTKVINQYTNIKDETKIQALFSSILLDLKLNTLQSASLKRSFDRYRQIRIGNRSTAQIDSSKSIIDSIVSNLPNCNNQMDILIQLVQDTLGEKTKKGFTSQEDLKAAIICEYIMEQ